MSNYEVERAELLARIEELESPMLAWSELDYTKHTRRSLMCYIGQQNFKIEHQAREIERLKSERSRWQGLAQHASLELAELAAMKSKSSGVVLPEPFEMRPFQTVDQGSTNYKAGFNAAIRKAREILNSPTVSAGVVDGRRIDSVIVPREMLATAAHRLSDWGRADLSEPMFALIHEQEGQARAAQPDHSAQSLNMVPDGWKLVPIELIYRITMTCYPKESDVGELRALLAQHEWVKP